MSRTRAIAVPAPTSPRLDRLRAGRLAHRAARGDSRAFESIFRRYHQELYRYCLGIVRNPADAEDALQATMAAALRALPGEDRTLELRPWLYRVAHNESITLIRGRREGELSEDGAGLVERSAAAHAEERERLRELVEDLHQLPDRQRSAILMRELNDVSYADIAGALGCSEGAARQTVYEARSALFLIAEGRAMGCEEARMAISSRDGRRLRGRRVRTHLRACDNCRDFQAVIAQRQADMRMLFPALPAAAAATLFSGLTGGATLAGTAAVGGGAAVGAALGTSAAVKGASVLAAAAVAVGAADLSGAIDLGGGSRGTDGARDGDSSSAPGDGPSASGAGASGAAAPAADRPGDSASAGGGAGAANGADAGNPHGSATGGDPGSAASGNGGSPGKSGEAPGRSEGTVGAGAAPGQVGGAGQSESAPGQAGGAGKSESAPGQVGGAGKSEAAPGHSGGGKSESAAPQADGGPGKSESAPGHTGAAGKSGSAPGHAAESGGASTSGTAQGASASNGNSASAPGHTGEVPGVGNVPAPHGPPVSPSGVKPGKGPVGKK